MNDPKLFEFIAEKIAPGSRLLCAWPMTGGVTAEVTALEVQHADGRTQKFIVREGGQPLKPGEEYRLTNVLYAAGLPVPKAHLADETYVVLDFIEGEIDLAPADVAQVAAALAGIHRLELAGLDLDFLPLLSAYAAEQINRAPISAEQARILDALRAVWPPASQNAPVLLHGDYWPGNLLWRDGRLVAVIDWEDPSVGDPLLDVANCHLELRWTLGAAGAQRFTDAYRAQMPHVRFDHLPYWDLYVLLHPMNDLHGWGLPAEQRAHMEAEMRQVAREAVDQL